MGARGLSADTCAGAGQLQVAIQVLEAADREALSTQTITEALTIDRRAHDRKAHQNVEMKKNAWESQQLRDLQWGGGCREHQRKSSDEVVGNLEGKVR